VKEVIVLVFVLYFPAAASLCAVCLVSRIISGYLAVPLFFGLWIAWSLFAWDCYYLFGSLGWVAETVLALITPFFVLVLTTRWVESRRLPPALKLSAGIVAFVVSLFATSFCLKGAEASSAALRLWRFEQRYSRCLERLAAGESCSSVEGALTVVEESQDPPVVMFVWARYMWRRSAVLVHDRYRYFKRWQSSSLDSSRHLWGAWYLCKYR